METAVEGAKYAGRQALWATQRAATRAMQQALDDIAGGFGEHPGVENMQEQYHGLLEIDTPSGPIVTEI